MKLELKIVDLLARNTEKKFTINEIAKSLKEYYSFVHRTIEKLGREGVILKEKVGKSYICTLNMKNEKTMALMQLGEIEKKDEFFSRNKELKLILEDFAESSKNADSIVLFGSYAKGTAKGGSDIDILIIGKATGIDKLTKEIYAKYGKEINPVIMTPKGFEKQKDKALIREIINSHYIVYGAEKFVSMVFG